MDNINHYDIKNITYVVTNVVSSAESPLLLNGKVTLSSLDDETINITTTFENVDLKDVQESTSELEEELSFSTEDFAPILRTSSSSF